MYECLRCGRQVYCGQHVCKHGLPSVTDVLLRLEAEGKISHDMPSAEVITLVAEALREAAEETP